jgi:hypothetical protein
VTVTWARFAWYSGRWHFAGFAGDEYSVREFEDSCAELGRPCVVLALSHAGTDGTGPRAITAARPPWQKIEPVPVEGGLLLCTRISHRRTSGSS